MKKEHAIKKKTQPTIRNSAIKNFLTTPPSYLTLQPIHVLILSLCFMGNIVLLHIVGRFGSSFGIQTLLSIGALVAAIFLGYLAQR